MRTGAIILALVTLIACGAAAAARFYPPVSYLVWILVSSGVGFLAFLKWRSARAAYMFPRCAQPFRVEVIAELWAPYFGENRLLVCPRCGREAWCQSVRLAPSQQEVVPKVTARQGQVRWTILFISSMLLILASQIYVALR